MSARRPWQGNWRSVTNRSLLPEKDAVPGEAYDTTSIGLTDKQTAATLGKFNPGLGPLEDTVLLTALRESAVLSEDYFSRTIVNEPGRAAGCTSHPAFTVTLQPSPRRVVPSSGPVTGTDSVDPSAARKTPPLAVRRPH
jgi:hypothetical protein